MGYLAVLRSPAMASLTVLSFVSSFVGYSQLNAGMPAFARAVGEVSTRALGLAFAANTLVIVVLQLVVLQRIEGRRRTRVIAVMGVVWAFAWLLLGLSGLVPGTLGRRPARRRVRLGVRARRDAAPAHHPGAGQRPGARPPARPLQRAQLGLLPARRRDRPAVSGMLIGHALGDVYIGLLIVGCLLCGLIAIAWLEPRLVPASTASARTDRRDGEITPPVRGHGPEVTVSDRSHSDQDRRSPR